MTQQNIASRHTELARPKHLPRYTSYPTALEFGALDGQIYDKWLKSLPLCKPVSLYFHIPYCEKLCWFCGCFTTISNKYEPVRNFVDILKQEIISAAQKTGPLKVSHIHFGGGSPSILEAADFESLIETLRAHFNIDDVDEFAIEIDPRTVDREKIFAYAHVPHIKKHHKLVGDHLLPTQKERQAQFDLASKLLVTNSYRSIGLDHFALPEDNLFVSYDQRLLKRNFQGYTEDKADTLIGFGPSAISSMPDGYAQNIPVIRTYMDKISAGQSPVVRGLSVSKEDKMFRDVISSLMCYFEVDPIKIAAVHKINYDFAKELPMLNKLVTIGYMEKIQSLYRITDQGKLYLRAIATIFDQYFDQSSDIIDRCIHESEG